MKKKEINELRKQYIQETGYIVAELCESEWWKLYKTDFSVEEHLRDIFPYKRPLCQDQLLEGITSGPLLGYVQCDIKVPEHVKEDFAIFSPLYKVTNVYRQDIAPLNQEYADKQMLTPQPRRMFFSSFHLTNRTINTLLLLFFMELGLLWAEKYCFVE